MKINIGDKYIGYKFNTEYYGIVVVVTNITSTLVTFTSTEKGSHWAFIDAFPRYFQPIKKE
jgi:hypothetical protein